MTQLLARWVLNALALWLLSVSGILAGFRVETFTAALVSALVLAIVNTFVRPVVMMLTLPVTCLTLGFFALVVNAAMLGVTAALVDGFTVGGPVGAIAGSLLLSLLGTVLHAMFKPER